MSSEISLLSCPFCGEKPSTKEWIQGHHDALRIWCDDCSVEVRCQSVKSNAIRAWNTRVQPTSASAMNVNAQMLEALKGVLRVADRKTDEFDAARSAIANAEAALQPVAAPDMVMVPREITKEIHAAIHDVLNSYSEDGENESIESWVWHDALLAAILVGMMLVAALTIIWLVKRDVQESNKSCSQYVADLKLRAAIHEFVKAEFPKETP